MLQRKNKSLQTGLYYVQRCFQEFRKEWALKYVLHLCLTVLISPFFLSSEGKILSLSQSSYRGFDFQPQIF
jgi:hypothetical protein